MLLRNRASGFGLGEVMQLFWIMGAVIAAGAVWGYINVYPPPKWMASRLRKWEAWLDRENARMDAEWIAKHGNRGFWAVVWKEFTKGLKIGLGTVLWILAAIIILDFAFTELKIALAHFGH